METTAIARRSRGPEITIRTPAQATPGIASYSVLRSLVRETLIVGLARIESETVRVNWQTGAYIREHVLCHRERAEYGGQVIKRLAEDIEVDLTELRRMVQFNAQFPIVGHGRQLSWSIYRVLLTIADDRKRFEFEELAAREKWTRDELRFRIRKELNRNPDGSVKREVLAPAGLGPLHHYRIVSRQNIHSKEPELLLDLGFSQRLEKCFFPGFRFTEGMIVTGVRNQDGRWGLAKSPQQFPAGSPEADSLLFTYRAFVERVVDGDTLKLEIHPGFGIRFTDKFRLKGIDCPELDTPEGRRAAKFVESELAAAQSVLVKTTLSARREKWGRFIADVFYAKRPDETPVYLNQLLLDRGHAIRIRE